MNPKLLEDRPEDLVDRLNGIYPSAIGQYKASPLEKEAAREIVRLREQFAAIKDLTLQVIDMCESEYGSLAETNELREMLGLGPYLMR